MGLCDTKTEKPKLVVVRASKTSSGSLTYIGDGHFVYKSEAIGVWKDFEGIDTPSIEELNKMTS